MSVRLSVILAIAAGALCLGGSAEAADPKVPPGQDPGGLAIALIGGGIDYTQPALAARLARDGEGELIGWDVVDNDRAPFAAAANPQELGQGVTDATVLSTLLLSAYAKGRLVPVRAPSQDPQALAKAIAFATGTPARIIAIALPLDSVPMRAVIQQASERFKDFLFVVAGDVPTVPAAAPQQIPLPSLMNRPNVLVVAAMAEVADKPLDQVIASADLVVLPRGNAMFGNAMAGPPRNGLEAVALAAAASACQGHGRPPLLGSAAKAVTLDAAQPMQQAPAIRGLDPLCFYGGVRF